MASGLSVVLDNVHKWDRGNLLLSHFYCPNQKNKGYTCPMEKKCVTLRPDNIHIW